MTPCPHCTRDLREGARFCPNCGAAVPAAAKTAKTTAPAPQTESDAVAPEGDGAASRTMPLAVAVAIVAVVVVILAAGVIVFINASDSDTGDLTASAEATVPDPRTGPATTSSPSGGSAPATSSTLAPTTTSAAPTATSAPPPGPLTAVSASASSEQSGVNSICTDEFFTFPARNAIDGDEQTGWGTAPDDGTGERLTVDFGRTVHLTSVGATPGYTKIGPNADIGCQSETRFYDNRVVTSARWTFDGGGSVVQDFSFTPTLQPFGVDVDTRRVTFEILGTVPGGGPDTDSDTIISEVRFEGY